MPGERQRSYREASLCTRIHHLFTCYNGCVSATTPPSTPHLGSEYALGDAFPCSTYRMSSRSFIFSEFYRGGFTNLWHEQLQQTHRHTHRHRERTAFFLYVPTRPRLKVRLWRDKIKAFFTTKLRHLLEALPQTLGHLAPL